MAEEQQNMSVAEGAQPPRGWLTPEQMEQIRALHAMFEQLKPVFNATQDPTAKPRPGPPPPTDKALPPPSPATPPPAAQTPPSATSSPAATQGSPGRRRGSGEAATRYMLDKNGNGEKSIRRYRRRPPQYDPRRDARTVCHAAAHRACRAIVRLFGSSGDW
jgi:hypothetical protein